MFPPGFFDSDVARGVAFGASLFAFLALVVVAINIIGKRLDKHDVWLGQVDEALHKLDLRVGNLHEDRRRRYVQSLQTIRPPPLDGAKTVEMPEELRLTLEQTIKKGDES